MEDSTLRRVSVGVSLGRVESRPARILAFLAQANNPRRLVQRNDDSDVGSCACPYTALLDGMPSRILRDRLFSPLCGLMVSRYRRGDAFTSTPEGQEFHLHGDEVVEDRLISAPYPPLSLRDGSFRETDRTSTGLLGQGMVRQDLAPCPLRCLVTYLVWIAMLPPPSAVVSLELSSSPILLS